LAISSYAELKAAVADWLERADLTLRIPDFIALAEASMNRGLRVRRMIARSTATMDSAFSAVPADYLDAKSLVLGDGTTSWPLDVVPPETAASYALGGQIGKPLFYSVLGDEFQIYPAPDRAYGATLTYYARLPKLSDANPSNWVLADHPDAYLYGALLQAGAYLRDAEALQTASAGYAAAIQAIAGAERTQVGKLRTERPLRAASYAITTDL
jgi:hypothetical protein